MQLYYTGIKFECENIQYQLYFSVAVYRTGYWKRRGILGPKSKPFFGNIKEWSYEKPMVFQFKFIFFTN